MVSTSNIQTTPSSSDPSSCSEHRWKYQVFLSFRGETRYTFTGHLYNALLEKFIMPFKDDARLEIGTPIKKELLEAIEKSRMAVIIISKEYASSTWCLEELVKIVECMNDREMKVVPIFYHVEPSDVRHQECTFGYAFAQHEQNPENKEKVQTWKNALKEVANLAGRHLKINEDESEFIKRVVKVISGKLITLIDDPEYNLVGMDSHVKEMNLHLDLASNDVRFIGICGMSGIGKTTLARVVFVRILHKFEASRFLENVREVSKSYGLAALQEQLLYNMKFKSEKDAWNVHKGIHAIRSRLCRKKVLIVLDDVDTEIQLQMLAGNREWFGPGSRIIITTTNRYLLARHGVQDVCLAKQLNESDALQLFIWKAFGKPNCGKEFLDFSKDFVNYAKGLPSTIKNLGCSLYGKSIEQWIVELDNLKAEAVDRNSEDADRFNFDGLWDTEKELFLDIACFFNGEDKDRVVDILDNSGCFPNIGIEVLKEKSFITIVGKKLWVHDSLRKVGWEIVS